YIGSTASSSELGGLLYRVMWEISAEDGSNKLPPRELKDMIREFPDWLNNAVRGEDGKQRKRRRIVIVLDALNQLTNSDNAHALHWLPRQFPDGVSVLVSTLPGTCLNALKAR